MAVFSPRVENTLVVTSVATVTVLGIFFIARALRLDGGHEHTPGAMRVLGRARA